MGLYQVPSNNSPGLKFDPTLGVTSFTRDYIGKTFKCPRYSLGVKFGTVPGVTSFIWAYSGKNCQISLYLAIRPRLTKFDM